jgi:hypothetical protein
LADRAAVFYAETVDLAEEVDGRMQLTGEFAGRLAKEAAEKIGGTVRRIWHEDDGAFAEITTEE